MTGDVYRVGKEPVYRKQGRYARKNRQQKVKGHPRRNQQDAIRGNTMVDSQENILPPLLRDFRGGIRGAASAVFQRDAPVTSRRLLAGATLAEAQGQQQRGKRDGPYRCVLRAAGTQIRWQISAAHAPISVSEAA